MPRGPVWQGLLRLLSLAVALLAFSGCVSSFHPVAPPPPELAGPCQSTPQCARDHVYVFFVQGIDVVDFANLSGVRDYVQMLGFSRTYYGQLYQAPSFLQEIRRIYHEDPEARFVLVGFSFGANSVRSLAESMGDEGIPVGLLVYLGGNTLHNRPGDQPENAGQIVNILASGAIWDGDTLDRAENYQVKNVWHFGSPTHPETLKILAQHLARVAASVPCPGK